VAFLNTLATNLAAAAKVTPVVTLRIPFGLDNHDDAGLADEVSQTTDKGGDKTGVPGIQAVTVMIGKNITGGVARADTHLAAAKTFGVAPGINAAQLDHDFTDNGRVKAVALG
jgi:hypothetical protein